MLDEIRLAAARQRRARTLRALMIDARQLISGRGEMNGMAVAARMVERLDGLDKTQFAAFFDFLARELNPDPQQVLARARAYAERPAAEELAALTQAVEPPRQELLRRLNRVAGGTAAILRLRRALLGLLPRHAEWAVIEADLLHLLQSWFNPGFLKMRRVDWNAPAQLLEKLIVHEAVHAIDGWDDLRRRLQPDRRCFAFFHPQLPDEPLIFVEVALVAAIPDAIAPLIDKASTPLQPERFRVACFYGISNCEPGLRGVSLGNFLIKTVATLLQRELPRIRTFCTLSPIPGFSAWLKSGPDLEALGAGRRGAAAAWLAARERLLAHCKGELGALQGRAALERMGEDEAKALRELCVAYLLHQSPTPAGDPVARFHLDNGARLERVNLVADLSRKGLEQSYGTMVNYLYDLERVETWHARFRDGEVEHARSLLSSPIVLPSAGGRSPPTKSPAPG